MIELTDDQREALEEHGHPAAWFICTISSRVTLECDACDEVLIVLSEDPTVCRQPHPES